MSAPIKTFQAEQCQVRVYRTHEQMAVDAAREVRACLQEGVRERGSAAAILPAGSSQIKFLEVLTGLEGIEWPKITLFHLDEYLGLDDNHSASFCRFVRERIAQIVKPKICHYLQGDALEPLKEIERYTRLLKAQEIDLCCIGIGENGHLAFNDPPVADFNDPYTVKLAKLDARCRQQQVSEGHFPYIEAMPQYAFTLTISALCAVRRMFCVVPEQRKAEAVRHALLGPISAHCPASILRRMPHATIYLDAESSGLL